MMDIQKEREAFEAHIKSTYPMGEQLAKDCGKTLCELYSSEWEAWQAAKAQAVTEWISVEDRLPPANILVLGMSQTPRNIFNIYNVMALDEFEEADVTHWMPIPQPPKAQEQKG